MGFGFLYDKRQWSNASAAGFTIQQNTVD